jgi:predicted ribosome quality control (RQC) complex YloA/Tae2 family protein
VDNLYLSAVVKEIAPEGQGRSVARVSSTNANLLIDLRLAGGRQLLVSMDRTSPAVYITSTLPTQLLAEKRKSNGFLSLLRKHIFDARLEGIWKAPLDRIVQMDFERLAAGDNRVRTTLVLMLTGRSANAHLIDDQGSLVASLFEQPGSEEFVNRNRSAGAFDPASLTSDLSDSITEAQALDRFWGTDSIFGPQLKSEFAARCRGLTPAAAFRSLIDDVFNREPIPLVYSRVPLDQVGRQLINPKADLLLSHVELVQARGMLRYQFQSLSEAADEYYSARARAIALRAEHSALRQVLTREITRREAAITAIESDRARFEDPDRLKRYGDLILANLANAKISGSSVTVVDYYDPNPGEIQIEIPEGVRLQEAAAGYFARYQKARRALEAIASRERDVGRNLDPLKELLLRLEHEPTDQRVAEVRVATEKLLGRPTELQSDKHGRGGQKVNAFGRRFRSTDGYEIVVGRNDRENDALTFRVARPNDIWLHASDYPGSHVLVRNPSRESVPHRTIIEAAELAAFYSQAKREGKAAVHYTQKKFVSKPPRSKPGLVRLSSFKTAVAEPRCRAERLD